MIHRELTADVAVIGGGLGGIAAALAAADAGARVVMTVEEPMIGGQVTSQLTSALDEHPLVETAGVTASYRKFRELVRAASGSENPGGGWVSRLCFEPLLGLRVLEGMLAGHVEAGRIHIVRNARPVAAIDQAGRNITHFPGSIFIGTIGAIRLTQPDAPGDLLVSARVFVDATELGDLLPLAGCRWVIGSEGRDAFDEPDAVPGGADPAAEQSCTWVAVLVREAEPLPVGAAPPRYVELRDSQPFSLDLEGWDGGIHRYRFFADGPDGRPPFWEYRRVRMGPCEAAVINWAGNDARGAGLVGDPSRARIQARELTLAFVHWLRSEAPRDPGDGPGPLGSGLGYPELRLAPELSGTPDGLALAPYVRESRRLGNPDPLSWHDIRTGRPPVPDPDSVAIAWYHADLHARVGHAGSVFAATAPFQIPARTLVPATGAGPPNLVMGAKNLAATQVAAAACRVHPGEWAIGEAAGVIAAASIHLGEDARAVIDGPAGMAAVHDLLRDRGAPIHWPDSEFEPAATPAIHAPELSRRDHA